MQLLDGLTPPVLWHTRTGRHLTITAAALAALPAPGVAPSPSMGPLLRRLHALHLLADSPPPPLARLIPCRSRLVLAFPDSGVLWLPDPEHRTPGGHVFRALPVSPVELAFWRACNGARSVEAAAERVGLPLQAALDLLATLTGPRAQAIQLREEPLSRRERSLERLVAPPRPANSRAVDQYGPLGETTLGAYHEAITDGARHFDDRETTVAHAFGLPHPGLAGQRYGERLFDVLSARGQLPASRCVVEVGPGDGELAEAFLSRAGGGLDYLRIDASPELLRTQRGRVPETRELLGSATALPLPDASVDLLVSNEVIADLSAVPWEPGMVADGAAAEVAGWLDRAGIPPLPGRALYNLGAWRFLAEIARVLAPGGVAWLSEFGTVDEAPEETTQLDHPEVSIHFAHLAAVAGALGLRATVEPLAELLGFDLAVEQLSRHSHEAIRARARAEGLHVAARARSPETLNLPWRVEGLHWVPLSEPGAGPLVTRFFAITLRR